MATISGKKISMYCMNKDIIVIQPKLYNLADVKAVEIEGNL